MVVRRGPWWRAEALRRSFGWVDGRVGWRSFPFDGGGRLRRYVVHDPVHLAHLVDYAARHASQDVVGYLRPVGGHAIHGRDGAYGYDVGVGAEVAHDAHALYGEEDGECLPYVPVEAGGAELFADNGVGFAKGIETLVGDGA